MTEIGFPGFRRVGADLGRPAPRPAFLTPFRGWNILEPMSSIRILVTGGTFDKEYDELSGNLFFQDTHVPEMLRLGRSGIKVELRTLMMVDSLDMSDADRQNILEHCRSCPAAQAFVQVLPPGVYVAMNGRALPWDRVRKNRKTGVFEEVEPRGSAG